MPSAGRIENVKVGGELAPEAPEESVEESVEEEVNPEDDSSVSSYELGPEEELWPGGPKGTEISEWKKVFGDGNVYVTSVGPENHIVWRTLTRFEYRRLVKVMEQQVASGQISQAEANLNNEEAVAETVILYPPYKRTESANSLAGVAALISQETMEASGFIALEVRQL